MNDGEDYILKYDLGTEKPGTDTYDDALNKIVGDYLMRVHHIRMELLELPPETRNWEQIEAREFDKSFVESVMENHDDIVLLRTVFTIGKQMNVLRIVDLVGA